MGPAPISTAFLLTSLAAVALLEVAAAAVAGQMQLPRIGLIGITRTLQMLAVSMLAMAQPGGMAILGLGRRTLVDGVKTGLIWSVGFAAAAGLLMLSLLLAGQDPLMLVRSPLPTTTGDKAWFFLVGGIVAPVAEEIVFRGLIFDYLRRWGLFTAVLVSTALFAALHAGAMIPATQIVGGVVFALAYQRAKSLMAPIAIHMLGNLAIFTLSLV